MRGMKRGGLAEFAEGGQRCPPRRGHLLRVHVAPAALTAGTIPGRRKSVGKDTEDGQGISVTLATGPSATERAA